MTSVDLPLSCACGRLRGDLRAEALRGARGICYCDDCQAYARWLGSPDLINPHGGTAVIQTWPAAITVYEGVNTLRLLRLSRKGLHRWYTACCRSPVANTLGPRAPFAGLMVRLLAPGADLDALYGPAHGVQGRFAPGGCPPGAVPSATLPNLGRAMGILGRGWWRKAHSPSPFFAADGAPLVAAQVLSKEERAAL